MLKKELLLLGFLLHLALGGQNMISVEQRLARLGRSMLEVPAYEKRRQALADFTQTLDSLMRTPQGYAAPLKAVKNMLKLEGPKGDFRVFTWQMPDENYRLVRYGRVVVRLEDTLRLHRLEDALDELPNPHFQKYGPEKWPGALYYELLPMGREARQYTLLGYAPGKLENRKVIEVLTIDKQGEVRFGAKIFRIENWQDRVFQRPPMRLIYRYSSKHAATVHWNAEEEMVVMDHLAPPSPQSEGMYRRYGPDFTYDALQWKNGWWHLKEGVEVSRFQE